MRGYLRTLTETGIVERRRCNRFPGNVELQLSDAGRELLTVVAVLSRWLAAAPGGPTAFGGRGAKSAITALVAGWSTSMIRALAVRPLSLTELDSVISGVSYPSLERRLGAMRLAGLLKRAASNGRATPYEVSAWLREAAAPLVAAARWERRFLGPAGVPISTRDIEAAFLLAVPLLHGPREACGSCRLAVEFAGNGDGVIAGVAVSLEAGRVTSCSTKLEGPTDAWVCGGPSAWFSAVIERDLAGLEVGGDCSFALDVVEGLRSVLLEAPARAEA